MPAGEIKLDIVLNAEEASILEEIARNKEKDLSQVIKELLELGLSLSEDYGLARLAEERLKEVSKKEFLTHDEIWD